VDSASEIILEARGHFAVAANAALTLAYYRLGEAILAHAAAETTSASVSRGRGRPGLAKVRAKLAEDLSRRFPDAEIGLGERSLRYAQKLVEAWRQVDPNFGRHCMPKLGWGVHMALLDGCVDDSDALVWYATQVLEQQWSVRMLRQQIKARTYHTHGQALSNYPAVLPASTSAQAQEMLNSPVLLPVLLTPDMKELDLEAKLIEKTKDFLIALGTGFTYKGNQVHLKVEDDDVYIDLLLFNTDLLCWVVVELKVTDFKPGFTSQLGTYVELIEDRYRRPWHGPTVGVLLCSGRNETLVRYALRTANSPIAVATYDYASSEAHRASKGNGRARALPKEVLQALPPARLQRDFDAVVEELGVKRLPERC